MMVKEAKGKTQWKWVKSQESKRKGTGGPGQSQRCTQKGESSQIVLQKPFHSSHTRFSSDSVHTLLSGMRA